VNKKEVQEARLAHLKFDQYMNTMTKPLLQSPEQKEFYLVKEKLLQDWIDELTENIENG